MTSLPDVFQLLDAVLHDDVNADADVNVDANADVNVDADVDADVDVQMDVANGNVYNYGAVVPMNDERHDAIDSFDLYDSLLI